MIWASRRLALAVVAISLAVAAVVVAVAFVVFSVRTSLPLTWVSGAVLVVLLVVTWVLCAHAGGHAWLVPVPGFALAVAWALAAIVGPWSGPATWWLAAASAALCAAGVLLAATALQQGHVGVGAGELPMRGAEGTALTALSPTGVVQVAGETWTAESVSGPLPAGVPIHVVSVRGLRLLVWSEEGTVPGADALES
jgi:membrane-bound ClpP family serine protease